LRNIESVIAELEEEQSKIEIALTALREIAERSGQAVKKAAPARGPRKRRISAEGRRRIAEAQRKRWAAKKSAQAARKVKQPAARKKRARKRAAKKATVVAATS
jgi:hypothetical protein